MDNKAFFGYYDRAWSVAVKAVSQFPADRLDWRPAEGMMTAGDLIHHISGAEEFFTRGLTTGEWEAKPEGKRPGSIPALVEHMETAHQQSKNAFWNLPAEDYQRIRNCPFIGDAPLEVFLLGMFEHLLHHRGQLYSYYRLLGMEPPSMYGK